MVARFLSWAGLVVSIASSAGADVVLHDFASPGEVADWTVSADDMVGGTSRSSIEVTEDGTAVFSGTLSKQGVRGFTSVRGAPLRHDFTGTDRLRLRVRGDGRTYMMRLGAKGTHEGVHYRASFSTRAGEWMEVDLPYAQFKPFFRAFWVAHGPLEATQLDSIGFMFVDERDGDFALEIDWIRAVAATG